MDGRYPREHKNILNHPFSSWNSYRYGKRLCLKIFLFRPDFTAFQPVFPFIIIEPIISSAACPVCLRVSGLFVDVNHKSQFRVIG
jgi:hypothetical protein